MAETPTVEEKREAHIRGVKVTAFSSILGVFAGLVSWILTSGVLMNMDYVIGVYVLVGFIIIQKPVLPYLDKPNMSTKDWLYVSFMTFDFWFISWTLVLTMG